MWCFTSSDTLHKKALILVFLPITVSAIFGPQFEPKGEILPDEDIIERNIAKLPNGTLSLSCSITPTYADETGQNATDMYWEFEMSDGSNDDLLLPPGYIINKRTLGIDLHNANESGTYYCCLNTTLYQVKIDHAYVVLKDPLQPVGEIQCVTDRNLNMTCSWCPDHFPEDELIGWTLEYTVNCTGNYTCTNDVSDFFKCSCTITEAEFYRNSHYLMNVTAVSDYGKASFQENVVSDMTIVKPGQVQDLRATILNSTSLNVSWTPEKFTEVLHNQGNIVYTVTLKDKDEDKKIFVGKELSFTLMGLHPYREYEVNVACKTTTSKDEELYWSDVSSVTNRTLADAPSMGPSLPVGAFKGYTCTAVPCLQIFWQEIAVGEKNGPIGGYKVTEGSREYQVSRVYSHTLHTLPEEAYTVAVQAWTEDPRTEGEKYLSPASTVWVDTRNNWLALPSVVLETSVLNETAVNETGVVWRWSYEGHPDNFTLFMCKKSAQDGTLCRSSPLTIIVPGQSREYHLDGFDPDYVYAMAANLDSQSSGLHKDWLPLCRYHKVPQAPTFFVNAHAERSLTVSWPRVVCSSETPTGLVHNYTIIWTIGEDQHSVTVGGEVTEFKIVDLLPYTDYNVTMHATSRAGSGPPEGPIQTRTQESKPEDSPREVEVSEVTSSAVRVSWNSPHFPNGLIHSYHVMAWGGTENQTVTSVGLAAWVQDLDGYVNYTVQVVAVNGAGASQPSPPVYALTMIRAPAQISDVSVKSEEENLNIRWAPPIPTNGPIAGYIITSEGNGTEADSTPHRNETVSGESLSHTLVFADWCHEFSMQQTQVMVQVQAFTLSEDNQQRFLGPMTEPQQGQICSPTDAFPIWVIVIAVAVPLVILCFVGMFGYLRNRKKYHEKMVPFPELPPQVILDVGSRIEPAGGTDPDSGSEDTSVDTSISSSARTADSGLGKSPDQVEEVDHSSSETSTENEGKCITQDSVNGDYVGGEAVWFTGSGCSANAVTGALYSSSGTSHRMANSQQSVCTFREDTSEDTSISSSATTADSGLGKSPDQVEEVDHSSSATSTESEEKCITQESVDDDYVKGEAGWFTGSGCSAIAVTGALDSSSGTSHRMTNSQQSTDNDMSANIDMQTAMDNSSSIAPYSKVVSNEGSAIGNSDKYSDIASYSKVASSSIDPCSQLKKSDAISSTGSASIDSCSKLSKIKTSDSESASSSIDPYSKVTKIEGQDRQDEFVDKDSSNNVSINDSCSSETGDMAANDDGYTKTIQQVRFDFNGSRIFVGITGNLDSGQSMNQHESSDLRSGRASSFCPGERHIGKDLGMYDHSENDILAFGDGKNATCLKKSSITLDKKVDCVGKGVGPSSFLSESTTV